MNVSATVARRDLAEVKLGVAAAPTASKRARHANQERCRLEPNPVRAAAAQLGNLAHAISA